jgi:AcrR family transcriptional regulator
MSNKEDLRVRRTKKALFTAFFEMVKTKTIDEITVNELCEEAGIRRATFYKHYADKYDFLTSYVRHLRDRFDVSMKKSGTDALTKEYYVAYAKRIVKFISENETAIDNIFRSNLFPTVMYTIVEQNYRDTCERLLISADEGMQLNASVEIVAGMCAGGIGATIYHWLAGGKKMSADELADQIGAVVFAAIGK